MRVATLAQLAELVGGRVIGDESIEVSGAYPLQDAIANCITLADHPKHASRVAGCPASAVIVAQEFNAGEKPLIVVRDLHVAFATIHTYFRPVRKTEHVGVHPTAIVDPSSVIGKNTSIAAGVTIGPECEIGSGCTIHCGVHIAAGSVLGAACVLHPNIVIYEDTLIGDRVLIHAGAVIGAFGFGYKQESGAHVRTHQLGWVEIGDDVEIGANATIDRGTYGSTKIGRGTKIDNLVQIGHNCHIGAHNLICAQVGIAGSSSTGDQVVLGGQVGLSDHIHLADNVMVGGKSGVMSNIRKGEVVFGSPAIDRKQKMQEVALVGKLPSMRRDLKQLKKEFDALLERLDDAASQSKNMKDAA